MSTDKNVAEALVKHLTTAGSQSVLFAGAGVSMKAGLPSWGGLIGYLAEAIRAEEPLVATLMQEKVSKYALTKAADIWMTASDIPVGDRHSHLKTILGSYDATQLLPLVSLPFGACLTTNFDRAILDAYSQAKGSAPIDFRLGDNSFKQAVWEKNFHVSRIHGCIENPESIVLSETQFKGLLADGGGSYVDLLTRFFTDRAVAFVGFSFYDPAIQHVFDVLDKRHGAAAPGRHLAIVPQGGNDFLQKAARLNITVVEYDPADHHKALWSGIEKAVAFFRAKSVAPIETEVPSPLSSTKKYLAACFARSRVASKSTPLTEIVLEGILSGMLQDAAPKSLAIHDIRDRVRLSIGVRGKDIERAVDVALKALLDGRLVRRHRTADSKGYKYAWHGEKDETSYLAETIEKLTDSVLNRALVQEGWSPKDLAVSDVIREFWLNIVLHRGWDLGAAFAANRPPQSVEMRPILVEVEHGRLSALDRDRLTRTIDDLLQRPTPEEATVLADLGQVSFALELAFQAPMSTLFHKMTLPRRIYLDANILMPAITEGHPNRPLYAHAIKRLQKAAREAGGSCQIAVVRGYLNEIISHRRNALDIASGAGEDFEAIGRSDVAFNGPANVNVYIGAYFVRDKKYEDLNFREFVERVAPFNTEKELAKYLESESFLIVESVKDAAYATFYGVLEKANAQSLVRGKQPILLEHDALQLKLLERDRLNGDRSFFVTADRRLWLDLGDKRYESLRDSMLSHVGLLQLIDLVVGLDGDRRVVGSLLWSNTTSASRKKIQSYLVAEGLGEYDAALAMSMHKIVEDQAELMGKELARSGLDLDSHDPKRRVDAFRKLNGMSDEFFAGMRKEIVKLKGGNTGSKA